MNVKVKQNTHKTYVTVYNIYMRVSIRYTIIIPIEVLLYSVPGSNIYLPIIKKSINTDKGIAT